MAISKPHIKAGLQTYGMRSSKLLALGVLAGLMLAFPASANAADKAPPAAHDQSDTDANSPDILNSQHIDGHIAFLHAELRITPEQEPLWTPVADAMRQDIKETENAERQVANETRGHESALQYLQNRVMFADLRAQGEARFLTAFQPLYQSLSARQKANADDLLITSNNDQ